MDIIYVKSMQGECENCHKKIDGEGYLILDKEKNTVSKCVCEMCKDVSNITKTKKIKIVVRKIVIFFHTCYEIVSTKNIQLNSSSISQEDLNKFLCNPDIEVQIKYQ